MATSVLDTSLTTTPAPMPAKRGQPVVDIDTTLKRVFGKRSFRSVQREVIEAALEGHDVYLQASTGLGKSLTFQLPAVVVDHGTTIVVSPLLSIMANQVEALLAAGIKAAKLDSSMDMQERNEIFRDLESGRPTLRLLYVTPELCTTPGFRAKLGVLHKDGELNRIVVDEAHCISEWGHDFRAAFKQLYWFKCEFPSVPVIAVTATATARVREDIIKILRLPPPPQLKIYLTPTSRSNLHYEIRYINDSINPLDELVKWLTGVYKRRKARDGGAEERHSAVSGLIYCSKRQTCEDVAKELRGHKIGARPYHAGLSNDEKNDTTQNWLLDKLGYDIIVATTAFGMGIDKPNVRFVVHWGVPKSFEGYYQEAGRGGRDGNAARCILFYSRESRDRTGYLLQLEASKQQGVGGGDAQIQTQSKLKSYQELVKYCENTSTCRHLAISRYFGDVEPPECDFACDICKDRNAVVSAKRNGLAAEEWVSTQRETNMDYYGGVDSYE
ncbi:P-loop containing nucleoside triphosphate hydrolase protein [Tricharina praecox]|uniref:P-loop containing nucleoside triphosphate hydrolase protein n=1 Tax=Tricharina praecox TaxID=43433 RepID=UPI002220CB1E|nr:P-loop containing nucleoside triphosphate hydrolase protein [Tricharina praecox]XP_051343676.1 P-loop containing nucleoside triphosphate hydrolase protein [Tricharina praecox]KAI5841304.1 P-loop containing nucleoside triphosphate hydrolase protein [Tricharina praecox]KAI5857930.1 P-loop containing nucleoside triphosphate hydrolase protein [Tricharina praecox]